jgi:hypothetical protein
VAGQQHLEVLEEEDLAVVVRVLFQPQMEPLILVVVPVAVIPTEQMEVLV